MLGWVALGANEIARVKGDPSYRDSSYREFTVLFFMQCIAMKQEQRRLCYKCGKTLLLLRTWAHNILVTVNGVKTSQNRKFFKFST